MKDEFWVDVKYITNEGEIIEFNNYEISNYGNIRSIKNGKVRELKPTHQSTRYVMVCLRKNNKRRFHKVHRLVLSSFMMDQYFSGAQVDHINSIRDDNRLENLRWVTVKENNNTDHRKKALSGSNNPMFGKKLSNETKQKISEANKGANHPMFGKKLSNETKQKMSEAQKGSKSYKAQPCFYNNKEFGSIKDAYYYAIENKLFDKGYTAFRKMIKKI